MADERYPADEEKDISDMTADELAAARAEVEDIIARMESLEPDADDDEYGDWADEMENLEDLLDDITDELDRRKRRR